MKKLSHPITILEFYEKEVYIKKTFAMAKK